MSLILLEGLDRTGKSTVAAYYESLGFEKVHLTAPPKELFEPGYSGPSYLDMMVEVLSEAAHKDIVMDRSHYGEFIWPEIFGRKSLLSEDDMEVLIELENSVGVKRIMMYDQNVDAHWKRCVANKEPINKAQFTKARAMYSNLAHKYNFELIALPAFIKQFPDAEHFNNNSVTVTATTPTTTGDLPVTNEIVNRATPEQRRLEEANAINDILTKRILKGKGPTFDKLENELRDFLNSKLGQLLGSKQKGVHLSEEEVQFFKAMYKRVLDKGEY